MDYSVTQCTTVFFDEWFSEFLGQQAEEATFGSVFIPLARQVWTCPAAGNRALAGLGLSESGKVHASGFMGLGWLGWGSLDLPLLSGE